MIYLVVGYGLTWSVLGWYLWRLERRSRDARQALVAERAAVYAGGGTRESGEPQ